MEFTTEMNSAIKMKLSSIWQWYKMKSAVQRIEAEVKVTFTNTTEI